MRRHARASTAGSDLNSRNTRSLPLWPKLALVVVLAVIAVMSLPSLAFAGTTTRHSYDHSFGSAGSGDGQLTSQGGLAIDQSSGDVYVADTGNSRVLKFDAAGNFLATWGWGVDDGSAASQVCTSGCQAGISGSGAGQFATPFQIAVDNSGGPSDGSVYVADSTNSVVSKFTSAGSHISTNDGTASGTAFGSLAGVAVNSSGDLWVYDANGDMRKFAEDGTFLTQWNSGVDVGAGGIAVDSSDNVFVLHSYGVAHKFGPSGTDLGSIDYPAEFCFCDTSLAVDPETDEPYFGRPTEAVRYSSTGTNIEQFGSANIADGIGIAVRGSNGAVYISDRGSSEVDLFASNTFTIPDVTASSATNLDYFGASVNGTINPAGVNSSWHFEYRKQGEGSWTSAPIHTSGNGTSDIPVSEGLSGLEQNATYEFRLVGTNTDDNLDAISNVEEFTTLAVPLPVVTIQPPTDITDEGAEFSGTVNPTGFSTSWRFEYSVKGSGEWLSTVSHDAGSGSSPEPVSTKVINLNAATEYAVRLVGTNPGGSATSSEEFFTTSSAAPGVYQPFAGPLTTTTARLNAYINPKSSPTTYFFEYGAENCESHPCTSVPLAEDASAGSAGTASLFSQEVSGLDPETTYHFRVVAENAVGTTTGDDLTFTTVPAALPTRGFELVNTPDKGNQSAFSASQADSARQATTNLEPDGNTAYWSVLAGAPEATTGAGSIFRATRTSTGWSSEPVIPPASEQIGGGSYVYELMRPASDWSAFLFSAKEGSILSQNDVTLVRVGLDGSQKILATLPGGVTLPSVDATSDLTHVLTVANNSQVYDYQGGAPELVSLLPNGAEACGVSSNEGFFVESQIYQYIATTDASRVYFESQDDTCTGPTNLYVRNRENDSTVLIAPGAKFVRATEDGRTAVYWTVSAVVPEDENQAADLYRYKEGVGSTCLTCAATNTDPTGAGVSSSSRVLVSQDLSFIYFESADRLVPGVSPPGGNLLYAWHNGDLRFVSRGDLNFVPRAQSLMGDGGRILTFVSDVDNVTTASTEGTSQMYRYDYASLSVECISCGVAPHQSVSNFFTGLSGDGDTAAFATPTKIVPEDVNGSTDIYEWRGGVVQLVTDGVTEWPTQGRPGVRGVSEDGSSIFVGLSDIKLDGRELDHQSNMYMARIGGGFPLQAPPAECVEDACQGPLIPVPPSPSFGSSTFSGPHNQVARSKRKRCGPGKRLVKVRGKKRCRPRHGRRGSA